jgi:hypothetical protein
VNLVSRLDEEGRLTMARQAVPPVPAELQPWADQAVPVDAAGRLLE